MTGQGNHARVLCLVYWGALEPLGRSLVVPAILRLAELGITLALITFEKPEDLKDRAAVEEMRERFKSAGIEWRPIRYHRRPKWPATVFDSMMAVLTALQLRMRGSFQVVHARTFVAGPTGYMIAKLIGARFVYHNEGFYPDEQVDGGVWREGSLVHRLAKRVENFLYDRADGLILLSKRAQSLIDARRSVGTRKTPTIVVSSAVDLKAFEHFEVEGRKARPPRLVYLGSVGLRYRLDEAGKFVDAVRRLAPGTTLTVVSRAGRSLVEGMLDSSGLPRDVWVLKSLSHDEVPNELVKHDAGLLFWPRGLSEHGCSPTKVGEYWASGLAVVSTPNVSDLDEIIEAMAVGVIVDPVSTGSLEAGAHKLLALLVDDKLRRRCRNAAQAVYSLESACIAQRDLFDGLLLEGP